MTMKREDIIEYWINSAQEDFEVMNSLLDKSHHAWALFTGHLVIEKLLKAYYVKQIGVEAPHTHDLIKIAEACKLSLTEAQKDFLDEVTTFNIKARYPDYKNRFKKKATKEFTGKYVDKIKEFRTWLKSLIVQQ